MLPASEHEDPFVSESDLVLQEVPFAFAAAIAPALGSNVSETTVRSLRHSADAISLEVEAARSVGLTVWTDGSAEMTWKRDGVDMPELQTYHLTSAMDLHRFLLDLRVRLHG
jgi:hypothetical protein